MKREADPITDDEWLLRRVYRDRFQPDRVPIISPNAFEPRVRRRDPDKDGISLYRATCLADPSEVLATVAPERRHEHGIVRIPMALLKSPNLTAVSRPDATIEGHVVIPELNSTDYEANKAYFTPIKVALATEASKVENILLRPSQS